MRAAGVCIAIVMLVGSTRAHAQCKPAVIAQGDPALVSGLTTRLAASGIATASIDGCPALTVRIEQRGTQVHVRLADASQRTSERDVQDIATAAAIVESWTYQEIEAGTLPEVVANVSLPMLERRTTRSGISASLLSGVGSNGATTWIGGAVSACLRIGPACVGATLRSQLDTRATGDTASIDQSMYALGALATLDLPRQLGSFVLSPGVGVGYGYQHVVTHHRDAMNNPVDLLSPDHQLRVAAHAALLKPLADHVSAFADLWTDAALLRSDSQFGPALSLVLALGLRLEAR